MRNNFLGRSLRLIALVSVITALSCATSSTRLFAHSIGIFPPGSALVLFDVTGPVGYTAATTTIATTGSGATVFQSLVPGITAGPVGVGDLANYSFTSLAVAGVHGDGTSGSLTVTSADGSTTHLTGSFFDVFVEDIIGNQETGVGLFTVTGGTAAGSFGGIGAIGGMHVTLENISGGFTFASNWTGTTKGEIGPVPEPGTIALLGTGLLGMIGYGRMRFGMRFGSRKK